MVSGVWILRLGSSLNRTPAPLSQKQRQRPDVVQGEGREVQRLKRDQLVEIRLGQLFPQRSLSFGAEGQRGQARVARV